MEIFIKLLLFIVPGFVLQPPLVMSSYVKGKIRLQVPWPLSFLYVFFCWNSASPNQCFTWLGRIFI